MKGNRQKEYTPNDSIYVELEEMQIICSDRKQISRVGVQRGERERERLQMGRKKLWGQRMFLLS